MVKGAAGVLRTEHAPKSEGGAQPAAHDMKNMH
jgi:hypothetical protein